MPAHEHRKPRRTSSSLDLSAPYVLRGEEEAIRSMARVGVEAFEHLLAIHAASEEECPRCEGSGLEPDLIVQDADDAMCSVCGGKDTGAESELPPWRLFDAETEEVNGYPTNEDAAHYEYSRERAQGMMVELHHRNEQGEWEVIR